MELKNKVVIVTGSSSGIGQAIATEFAKKDSKLVITYKSNRKGAKETERILKKIGVEYLVVKGDFSRENDVDNLFGQTLERFKTVDILINNAGRAFPKPFLETDRKYWTEHFNDNFFNTVLCSKKAFGIMQKQGGGKIINMSSINGLEYAGRPDTEAYSAAKAAVINFTKTLANAGAPKILVNAVAPGKTRTSYYDQFDEKYLKKLTKDTPIERFINVEEIAKTFVFIAENDALTGELIVVDGGFSLKDYK